MRIAICALLVCFAATAQAQSASTPPIWADQTALDCTGKALAPSSESHLLRVDLERNSLCLLEDNKCPDRPFPFTVERKSGRLVLRVVRDVNDTIIFEILPNGKYTVRKPDSSVVMEEGVCQKAGA